MILGSPPLNFCVVTVISSSGRFDELLSSLVICDLDRSRIGEMFLNLSMWMEFI